MGMDYRWGCQDLSPRERVVLTDFVERYKAGEEVLVDPKYSRETKSLQKHYYIRLETSTNKGINGAGRTTYVVPTPKSLALWVDEPNLKLVE